MSDRKSLQEVLEEILKSTNVYFQPPASVLMKYPAIVYALNDITTKHADDHKYLIAHQYLVTYIHKDVNSEKTDEILKLPHCSFDRRYTSNNLYHDVYILYY